MEATINKRSKAFLGTLEIQLPQEFFLISINLRYDQDEYDRQEQHH